MWFVFRLTFSSLPSLCKLYLLLVRMRLQLHFGAVRIRCWFDYTKLYGCFTAHWIKQPIEQNNNIHRTVLKRLWSFLRRLNMRLNNNSSNGSKKIIFFVYEQQQKKQRCLALVSELQLYTRCFPNISVCNGICIAFGLTWNEYSYLGTCYITYNHQKPYFCIFI